MRLKRFNDIVNENTEFEFGEDPQNDLEYFIIVKDRNGEVSFEEIELREREIEEAMAEMGDISSRSEAIKVLLSEVQDDYNQEFASTMVLTGKQVEDLVYKMHPNH